jgi:uncharacterized protein YcbX
MAIGEDVGSVATLWRFPVKSMGGEQLHDVEVTERGVLGDRSYALIDKDTGKVVSAKSAKLFPNLLDCKAAFVEPPRRGGDLPPVQILLPDSTTVRSDSGEVDRLLSAYFKRNVTLERAAPVDFTIDQYHPDVEGADPGGNRDTVALLDPRCVMTTLAQDGLPQDTDVLRTLVGHNRVQVGDLGKFPCAGVYAVVAASGTVRIGDRVVLN